MLKRYSSKRRYRKRLNNITLRNLRNIRNKKRRLSITKETAFNKFFTEHLRGKSF